MLKKLFKQRKMHLRPCYRTGHHLICNPGTLRYKASALALKKSKEKSLEEFGCRLDSNFSAVNKVFW